MPEGDDEADKYELADEVSRPAGYGWYEVSNWSRDAAARCRHNEGYWRGDAWWGVGPGRAQPRGRRALVERQAPQRRMPRRLAAGASPAAGRETLTAEQRHDEAVLLGVRLREGLPVDVPRRRSAARRWPGSWPTAWSTAGPRWRDRRVVLTLRRPAPGRHGGAPPARGLTAQGRVGSAARVGQLT